jgi:hypothetical protein
MIDLTEEELKQVENHITTNNSVSVWTSRNSSTKGDSFMVGPCHAQAWTPLTNTKKYLYFASNAAFVKGYPYSGYDKQDEDTIDNYLEWLFGPISPYRNVLLDDFKLIRKNDRIRGFILGDKASNPEGGRGAIMNLCVAARFMRDWTHYFKQMSALQHELGLSIEKAFLLCPYFALQNGKWIRTAYTWDAGHNPLRECQYGNPNTYFDGNYRHPDGPPKLILNIAGLKSGEYDYNLGSVQQSSMGWMKKNADGEQPLSVRCSMAQNVLKSRFSSVSSLPGEGIINLAKEIDL